MSSVLQVGTPGRSSHSWTVVDEDFVEVEPIDRYLRHLHHLGRSPHTLRAYARALRMWWDYLSARHHEWDDPAEMLDVLGAWYASLLRPVTDNVVALHAEPARSEATVDLYLTAVYGFYQYHQRNGTTVLDQIVSTHDGPTRYKSFLAGLAKGPSKKRLVGARRSKKRPKTLTFEQAEAVLDAQTNNRDRLLFALLFITGMRIGQALGLRHGDIDVRQRRIKIMARLDNPNGARAKSMTADTGTELATVHIDRSIVELYTAYLQDEFAGVDSDFVFVNLWGGVRGAPMTYNNVNSLIRATRRRVGFHFTAHQFRHTFATTCLESGMEVSAVSKLLGHSSIATTSDIYSHLSPGFLRAELESKGLLAEQDGADA